MGRKYAVNTRSPVSTTYPCSSGTYRLIPSSQCPSTSALAVMLPCNRVAVGQLCEGDGECGTNGNANNCGIYEVYRKYAVNTRQPTRSLTRSPVSTTYPCSSGTYRLIPSS